MQCNICGSVIQDGINMCPVCGAQLIMPPNYESQQYQQYQSQQYQGQEYQQYQPYQGQQYQNQQYTDFVQPNIQYQQPVSQNPQPVKRGTQKKSKKPVIIAAVVICLLGAVAGILLYTGVIGKNGKYKLDHVVNGSKTLYASDHDEIKGSYLQITGNKAKFKLMGKTATAKVKWNGNTVTFTDRTGEFEGTYDSDDKSISVEMYGITYIFKK